MRKKLHIIQSMKWIVRIASRKTMLLGLLGRKSVLLLVRWRKVHVTKGMKGWKYAVQRGKNTCDIPSEDQKKLTLEVRRWNTRLHECIRWWNYMLLLAMNYMLKKITKEKKYILHVCQKTRRIYYVRRKCKSYMMCEGEKKMLLRMW